MRYIKFLITLFLFSITIYAASYDTELLLHETYVELKGKKLHTEVRNEIRINNREGEEFTKITIPYSKLVHLTNIKAHVEDANGNTIKKLNTANISERSAISHYSFFEDDYVKEFTLRHHSYPYTIVYSYNYVQDEFMFLDHWIPILDTYVPTRKAKLTIRVPEAYAINYYNQWVNEPSITTLGNETIFHWETSYNQLVPVETYSPPIETLVPTVIVVPVDFTYDKPGSLKSWVTYGNWQYELIQNLNDLPIAEITKINELVQNIEGETEKIRILYHYLQDNTRYINVSIETGGLKPYPASYVSQNKYGDCKALTIYFKSMLEHLNIESFYTKINAGESIIKPLTNFPSQQSNHIILYIPLQNDTLWLDCTSNGPFNYLGTACQNRKALVVDSNGSRFIKTPPLRPNEVLEQRNISIKNIGNIAHAHFDFAYEGKKFESFISLENNYNRTEKDRIMRNYVVENGFQLDEYTITTSPRDTARVSITYKAKSQNIYKQYGDEIVVNSFPFDIPRFEAVNNRELPVQIDFPILKTDTIEYQTPAGYQINSKALNHTITCKYGQYTCILTHNNTGSLLVKSFLLNAGQYTLDEYEQFYAFIKKVDEYESRNHIIYIQQ